MSGCLFVVSHLIVRTSSTYLNAEKVVGEFVRINDSSTSYDAEYKDNEENANQRREAEELVKRLKEENPDRSMDQIMMHPEMAQLMIKHLHTEK